MSDDPVVIRGTRRAMKELADGTIRVQIDIDPPFRKAFLALFSEIDMPIALAPLQAKPTPDEAEATTERVMAMAGKGKRR